MSPISPDDWRRLEPLFDELLDLAPDARQAWLADRPDLSPADLAQLRELLRSHTAADGHLDTPLPESAGRLVAASLDDPLLGQRLGPYEVVEEIGRGGMGVVYLGRRQDGEFTQNVVIKVLRLGADSEDARRRFIQERQILADLDHPGIVKLLDGGFTPDGRPYLVMNRVVGQRLDSYCDRKQLDVRERVRLFLGVIEAVDYAHRHLVIHRDLKPSNVWIDEEGKVHLLDFGIAKIADEKSQPQETITGHRLLTPEYASPEQIRQENITTASDVYQLGVLLFRLLTGQYPYDLTDRTPLEVQNRICDTDPSPASRMVTTAVATRAAQALNQKPDYVFTSRRTTPGQLKNILRGDLDLILQKTLRKEPGRRYRSANELRADLIRWLSGDRILARPDSVPYQLRRFVRRHPLGVTLLATLLVCVVGFSVFHVKRITAERDIARQEAARRKEVSDFLVNLLKVADPTSVRGREVTARELLVDSFGRIDDELSDPETKIRLLGVMGEVASNLGLFELAGPALAEVVNLSTEQYGRSSPQTAAAAIAVANLWRQANLLDDAIGAAEMALEIRREILPPGEVEIARALKLVALIHREQRRYDLAEKELREAAEIVATHLPPDDPLQIVIQVDLAYVLRTVGQTEEAERLYRGQIPLMRAREEEFPVALPGALNNLAYLLRKQERFAEAEPLYREALARNESYYGRGHPSTVMIRTNLASVLQNLGRLDEAERQLVEVIALQTDLMGPDHWRAGSAHRALGYFLFLTGKYTAAEAELRVAEDVFARGLGTDHLWTAAVMAQRAVCLDLVGRTPEAELLWRRSEPVLATEKGRQDRTVRAWLSNLLRYLPEGHENWRARLNQIVPAVEKK